jgi:hypothetical protein
VGYLRVTFQLSDLPDRTPGEILASKVDLRPTPWDELASLGCLAA